MSDRLGSPRDTHDGHDLERVARAAAGDLAAAEAMAARDQLAACRECAALDVDLRAIAAATRDLAGATAQAAPRDFRLTETDAARLRRRGVLDRLRVGGRLGAGGRALGGTLATLGIVGLLVSAGLPGFFAADGGPGGGLEPGGTTKEDASPIAAMATQGPGANELVATGNPSRATDAARDMGAAPPTTATILAIASTAVLVIGLALLVAGLAWRRAGP